MYSNIHSIFYKKFTNRHGKRCYNKSYDLQFKKFLSSNPEILPDDFPYKYKTAESGDTFSLTGIILKKRYCILEEIGRGGGGHLYLARDLELGTLWAVKEVPADQKKEAKLLLLLDHPSLPRMIDYTERDEYGYLVMEYIKGKSLGTLLKEGKRFSMEEVLEITHSLAEIIHYLHRQTPPVYYGDLKPDNLMLTEQGKLYLVDFGSAVTGYEKKPRICYGTKGYAAPEQYEGRVGPASDVYAFGRTIKTLGKHNRWRLLFSRPGFWWIIQQCCFQNEKFRIPNMEVLGKKLQRLEKKKKKLGMTGLFVLGLLFSGTGLFAAGILLIQPPEKVQESLPLEQCLTRVTEAYYETKFQKGTTEERIKICQETEKELRILLEEYPGREEQRRLLLLLALNSELKGEEETTCRYYEQLLLYYPEYEKAYGEYGNYLWRLGEKQKSAQCWKEYETQKRKGVLQETGKDPNIKIWEERMQDYVKESERN